MRVPIDGLHEQRRGDTVWQERRDKVSKQVLVVRFSRNERESYDEARLAAGVVHDAKGNLMRKGCAVLSVVRDHDVARMCTAQILSHLNHHLWLTLHALQEASALADRLLRAIPGQQTPCPIDERHGNPRRRVVSDAHRNSYGLECRLERFAPR
eukprot:scaffold18425_cov112-Isochrysis_galbana.AAC.10